MLNLTLAIDDSENMAFWWQDEAEDADDGWTTSSAGLFVIADPQVLVTPGEDAGPSSWSFQPSMDGDDMLATVQRAWVGESARLYTTWFLGDARWLRFKLADARIDAVHSVVRAKDLKRDRGQPDERLSQWIERADEAGRDLYLGNVQVKPFISRP